MKNYKLVCMSSNEKHTTFSLFDRGSLNVPDSTRANCGRIVLDTCDLLYFLKYNWNGDVDWAEHCPDAALKAEIAHEKKMSFGLK